MPLYDYRCAKCGQTTEIRHGFNDTFSEPCAHCGGAMSRVFNPAPIIFKGSGYYVTDSRPASSSGESSPAPSATPAPSTTPSSSSSGESAA
jgi:putative FmdB family regulatory protein